MKNKNLFWGITLILIAVCLLLSYTDIMPDIPFYKILLTLFFAYMTIKGIFNLSFYGSLMSLAFLGCLYSKELGITSITPLPLLFSAFLCSAGLSLIFKKTEKKEKIHFSGFNREQTVNFRDDSFVAVDNNFGSINKYVNSNSFSNARINNSFGKSNIYFDNATLQTSRAEIQINNSFGEVNVYLPYTWKINLSKRATIGDIKVNGRGSLAPDAPEITIFATTSFGAINIYFN